MFKRAEPVVLTAEDRRVLESWTRGAKTEQRLALRARIILAAAAGQSGGAIARIEGVRPATVSQWCGRFARRGRRLEFLDVMNDVVALPPGTGNPRDSR